MARIIIITECLDDLSLRFFFVKQEGKKRRLIKSLCEVQLIAKYPMLDDDQILYEFVKSYARTLCRELGCEKVVWDYN